MQRITPHLWFDKEAEEAAHFYVSIFPNSKILETSHYPDGGQDVHGQEAGSVMTVAFELDGQPYFALNAGPLFKFNEAISFMVPCDTQEEIDEYWGKLSAVPEAEQCGWLKDKFGLSWQITPANMGELMSGGDPAKAGNAMQAMLKMKKIDIAALDAASK